MAKRRITGTKTAAIATNPPSTEAKPNGGAMGVSIGLSIVGLVWMKRSRGRCA
jgi:hypothetical protein